MGSSRPLLRSLSGSLCSCFVIILIAISIRVGSSNWVDYIPLLRILPSKTISRAVHGVRERQPYLDKLYQGMRADAESGNGVYCIGANLLSDKESKLTNGMSSYE